MRDLDRVFEWGCCPLAFFCGFLNSHSRSESGAFCSTLPLIPGFFFPHLGTLSCATGFLCSGSVGWLSATSLFCRVCLGFCHRHLGHEASHRASTHNCTLASAVSRCSTTCSCCWSALQQQCYWIANYCFWVCVVKVY